MYLKALEIQGFKSFPEKTRLTFDENITVIVGPNGSGKSNISDAVSWVLGEQSAKTLRSGKMEDVIFGGTQQRSQLGFAQVSLILDNTGGLFNIEGAEVMVSRRYYRSGESEYYINKKSVRLKDIYELFMDTGLGKEGYSIIGQGKIDNILSEKSTDRREIFEEAAGISRFRHRKEEAERKLERTQENLVRVNDKISELELQLEPMRIQAETAKKYLLLRDKLRSYEVSVWLETLEKIKVSSLKMEHDFLSAKQQLESENKLIEELYAAAELKSEQMRQKDLEAEALRDKISSIEAAAAELESAAAVLRANLQNNFDSLKRLESELTEHEGRAAALTGQIDQRKSRITEIDVQKAAIESNMCLLLEDFEKKGASADEISTKLNELLRLETEESSRTAEAKENLSALASSLQEISDREDSLASELASVSQRLENEREVADAREIELKAVKEEESSLKNVISGHILLRKSRLSRAEALGDKKAKLTTEQSTLKARIAMLSEMEKDFEGYSKSVKFVMQESGRGALKNILGPIANVVKTGDKYALAIETALGASMQSIIVEREEDGKAAISMLKRRDGGRATFLPLTSIKGTALREQGLDSEEGFEGIAATLVNSDKRYEQIILSLLGRTAIVEDMDSAIRIARKYQNRFRLVTLDGQVINAGGSMTGGSSANNAGILSRANEIIRLKEQEQKLSNELTQIEKDFSEAERELSAVNYELEIAESEKRRLEDKVLKAESEISQHKLLTSALNDNCETLKISIRSVNERTAKCEKEITEAREFIQKHERTAAELRAKVEEHSKGKEELAAECTALSDKLSEMRTALASLEAERAATEKAISELDALNLTISGDRGQRALDISELKAQNEEITLKLAEHEKHIEAQKASVEQNRKLLTETINEKFSMEATRGKTEKEAQEKNRLVLDMEKELSRIEQKKLAAEMEEKQIVDKLWDNYGLSRSSAETIRVEYESTQKAQRLIAELKRDMEALGSPNLGAIEEYERISERYNYLTSQRDDIESAKAEIEKIIRNITSEMRHIFAKEFKAINERFQETFVELFGGGKASLELEDESDILSCGIEIHVQPPGKSLKTLTLLSGGEKAFVAIALYFAILKVRPTPFCVMDEIEAALDEANVQRFARYMRRMTGGTQFIVITHRRGTMEEADLLYGVTMQEQGVSKVLGINLNDANKGILTA